MGHESQIEPWLPPDHRSALLVSELKASSRRSDENRWQRKPKPQEHNAPTEHMARVGQNRSRSIKWAEKQENFQPKEMCFFLTSTFIEHTRSSERVGPLDCNSEADQASLRCDRLF